jgi:hypothetical protein
MQTVLRSHPVCKLSPVCRLSRSANCAQHKLLVFGGALPADDTDTCYTTVPFLAQLTAASGQLPRADSSSEGTAAWAQMQPSGSSSSSAAASASSSVASPSASATAPHGRVLKKRTSTTCKDTIVGEKAGRRGGSAVVRVEYEECYIGL